MVKIMLTIISLLVATSPCLAQDVPFKFWYGKKENKAATEYSRYTQSPKLVIEKVIEITSLQNNLVIVDVIVNRGNASYEDLTAPFPSSLKYGQKISLSETGRKAMTMAAEEAKKNNLRKMEADYAMLMALSNAKDAEVLEVEVVLGDGHKFLIDINKQTIIPIGKNERNSAMIKESSQSISKQTPVTDKTAIMEISETYSGKVTKKGSGANLSYEMTAKSPYLSQPDIITIENLSRINTNTLACLEQAANSDTEVKIKGKFTSYADGRTVAIPETLFCEAGKTINLKNTLKLTEAQHNKFSMESELYALADVLLNSTWKQVKPNVSDAQYKQILQEQRQWASKGRDAAASRYAASMPEVEAFAKAMQDRTTELAKLIAVEPMRGTFKNKFAEFTAILQGDSVLVEGDSQSEQGNLCGFDGKGTVGKGWIAMKHDDFPDFYILFTPKGAQVAYTTSGEAQGCGANVGFSGSYTKK